jgi:hypothetical protein
MSGWDQYVTNLTSQGITHAGIFGADGSRWAASPKFPVNLVLFLYYFNIHVLFSFRQLTTLKKNCRKFFLHHHQALW